MKRCPNCSIARRRNCRLRVESSPFVLAKGPFRGERTPTRRIPGISAQSAQMRTAVRITRPIGGSTQWHSLQTSVLRDPRNVFGNLRFVCQFGKEVYVPAE